MHDRACKAQLRYFGGRHNYVRSRAKRTSRTDFRNSVRSSCNCGVRIPAPACCSGENHTSHTDIKHTNATIQQQVPAICTLENWIPFLKTNSYSQADPDGIMVSRGRAEYSVFGPYWTLPAGRYEVIASIVQPRKLQMARPVITLDVATDSGRREVAKHQWRLGQFEVCRCASRVSSSACRSP